MTPRAVPLDMSRHRLSPFQRQPLCECPSATQLYRRKNAARVQCPVKQDSDSGKPENPGSDVSLLAIRGSALSRPLVPQASSGLCEWSWGGNVGLKRGGFGKADAGF